MRVACSLKRAGNSALLSFFPYILKRSPHRIFPMSEAEKFFSWWKADKARALCTLEQAVGAYCSTFPGRMIPLLVELLETMR